VEEEEAIQILQIILAVQEVLEEAVLVVVPQMERTDFPVEHLQAALEVFFQDYQ
jgi:hypothetical protein